MQFPVACICVGRTVGSGRAPDRGEVTSGAASQKQVNESYTTITTDIYGRKMKATPDSVYNIITVRA